MDLDEFAAEDGVRHGYTSAIDKLPEELREQIMSSQAGHATAARWLRSLGYDHITQGIINHYRLSRGWSRD